MQINKLVLFLFLMVTCTFSMAQTDKVIESKISSATVFLSRAQVTREVKTRIEAGKTNLVITGLTAQLDPESIQISGKGSFTILAMAHQQNFLSEQNLPKALKLMKDSVELLQRQVMFESSQKEILAKEEQMVLSNQKIGGGNQNLTVNELKAMADFFRARLTELVSTRMKQDEKIKKLNDRIARLNQQINEQNAWQAQNTSEIAVTVMAEAPTAVELTVDYIVANAGWYPVYDLRAMNTKSPLQLNYKANVFQNTGEEWKNIKLKLSSANPSQSGLKPELQTWYLNFYSPVLQVERNYAMQRAASAPAAMKLEDAEADLVEARTSAGYVNTIQTSLNTEFNISLPYSIVSGAKPTIVDVSNHQVKAEYLYSVAPKLDAEAFLLAKAIGWEEYNLLPGEANIFFEGTFVGKTFIDPNNIKDTLSISLGRDKRIVVKREKMKDLSSRKLIGGSQRESYAYEISVRNTKTESIKILLEDQIPISQNTQIEVILGNLGGAQFNAVIGKLSWNIVLPPSESKKVAYSFDVKYPKDKIVNGF